MFKNVVGLKSRNQPARRAIRLVAVFVLTLAAVSAVGARSSPSSAITPRFLPDQTPASPLAPVVPGSRFSARPLALPGQPGVDANTVALYHFDSDATDATGRHNGMMFGNASITSALYGNGLNLDGAGSNVRTDNLEDTLLLTQGTIEAFVDFSTACANTYDVFTIISASSDEGQPTVMLYDEGMLSFAINAPNGWLWTSSMINPCRYLNGPSADVWPYETWRFHHVAGTWGPRGTEIWVDGVLHGVGVYPVTSGIFGEAVYPANPVYCNPQDQLGMNGPNPYYPDCASPRVQLQPYPLQYKGGIKSSDNFMIGCDPVGWTRCFKGRIDEVRISNIQRTFSYTLVPTSTPLPTATAVSMSGEYAVDQSTLWLYHLNSYNPPPLNSVFESVNQQYSGGLGGSARVTDIGRFNLGMTLDGWNSYLSVRNTYAPSAGTVEAWVKLFSTSGDFGIVNGGAYFGAGFSGLTLGALPACSNHLCFGILDSDQQWHWVNSGIDPSTLLNTWHHVAGTWGPRGLELWVDGALRARDTTFRGSRLMDPNNDYILFGCTSSGKCMNGMIDEVRFSNVQRSFVALGSARTPTSTATPTVTPTIYWTNLPFLGR